MAEQFSGFAQLRDCLSAAGTSLSVTEMKLLYDDGCLAAQIPDSRGTFSIWIYITNSPGLFQNLGSGRVLSGICITFSQNGLPVKVNIMARALGLICIISASDINLRRDCFLRCCNCINSLSKISIFEVRRGQRRASRLRCRRTRFRVGFMSISKTLHFEPPGAHFPLCPPAEIVSHCFET